MLLLSAQRFAVMPGVKPVTVESRAGIQSRGLGYEPSWSSNLDREWPLVFELIYIYIHIHCLIPANFLPKVVKCRLNPSSETQASYSNSRDCNTLGLAPFPRPHDAACHRWFSLPGIPFESYEGMTQLQFQEANAPFLKHGGQAGLYEARSLD